MQTSLPPLLRRDWPAIAAGTAALLGMTGCGMTILPFMIIGAPFAGVAIALGVFRVMLAAGPLPANAEVERRQLWLAGKVATVVSVVTCVAIGMFIDRVLIKPGEGVYSGVGVIAAVAGLALGGILSTRFQRAGAAHYRERREEMLASG